MNHSIITLKEGEYISLFESDHSPVIAFINGGDARHIDDAIKVEAVDDCTIIVGQPERVELIDRQWDRTLYMCCKKGVAEIPYNPIQPGWRVESKIDIVSTIKKLGDTMNGKF